MKTNKTIKPGAKHNEIKLYAIKTKNQVGIAQVEHIYTKRTKVSQSFSKTIEQQTVQTID